MKKEYKFQSKINKIVIILNKMNKNMNFRQLKRQKLK